MPARSAMAERWGTTPTTASTAMRTDHTSTVGLDQQSSNDSWFLNQGGFRMDWAPGDADILTFQGDAYDSHPEVTAGLPETDQGGNLLARWKQPLPGDSDIQVQGYYDWYFLNANTGFSERVATYDLEAQHRFHLGTWNEVTWGGDIRTLDDTEVNLPLTGFQPAQRYLHLYSGFAQDQATLVKDRLKVALGSKFEENAYTGFDTEPSGRFDYTPDKKNAVWGAISRAERTPSRLETDLAAAGLVGNPDFQNEKVLAYELGLRSQPLDGYSFSLSTFYNRYRDLRSVALPNASSGGNLTFGNAVQGSSFGVELAANGQVTDWLSVRGGYTFFKRHLEVVPGQVDISPASSDGDDPEHHFIIQASVAATRDMDLGAVLRYVSALPSPHVPGYAELDLRAAYRPIKHVECSVVGQNLLHKYHEEFSQSLPTSDQEIPRSMYGNVTVRW